jgi:multidrug resistance efflux pump
MIQYSKTYPASDANIMGLDELEILPRLVQPSPSVPEVRPRKAPGSRIGTEPPPEVPPRFNLRQSLFRCVRLLVAGTLTCGAGSYFWNVVTQVSSEQAVVTTDILALRSPIEGQLRLPDVTPGAELASGASAFQVTNERVGNKEVSSQLNWARQQVERLQGELAEAAVHLEKQEAIFAHHQKLYEQKVTAMLEFLNEEARLAAVRASWSNKQVQLRQAESRTLELDQQVALQRQAAVPMPFAGIIWAVAARDGAPVAANETVLRVFDPRRVWVEAFVHEKHADKFSVGTPLFIRTIDGKMLWNGRVEAVRGRGGPSTMDNVVSVMPAEPPPGRMAVRVKMERMNPFTAREFYGVGRSVIVSLEKP